MRFARCPASRTASILACSLALIAEAPAQQGAALFDAPIVAFDEWSGVRKLADVDGDGRVEALGWWWTTNYSNAIYASIHRQAPAGTWSLAWRQTIALGTGSLRDPVLDVGFFDGDTRADWAISLKQELRVMASLADGTPRLLWSTVEPDVIERILALDYSGDGRTDLAVVVPGKLRLWRNEGSSFVLSGELLLAPLAAPIELEPGDVDGDTVPDLLLSDASALRMVAIANGAPGLAQTFTHGLSGVRPAAGDIDRDGDRDVVLWGMSPDSYVVLRRVGATAFTQEPAADGGPARYLIDVDGDGDLDGVCCGGGGPSPRPNKTVSEFRVAFADQGRFAPSIVIPAMGSERLAAAIDLDADGDLDLVGGRCIYYARGPIRSAPHQPLAGWNVAAQFHDVEGDGDIDRRLRFGNVDRNSADGRFVAATLVFPAPAPGTSFEQGGYPGDFDGDGDVDLIVRHMQGSELLSMRLMRNAGGAFTDGGPAGPAGVDFHPMREWYTDDITNMPADLDGDGDLDLLTFTRDGAVTHFTLLWRNLGGGVFEAAGRINSEIPQHVADLDGDGRVDLVVVGAAQGYAYPLRWWRGTGGMAFTLAPALPGPPVLNAFIDRVDVADWDGDGDLDLLGGVVGPNAATSLLVNDGRGTFVSRPGLPATDITNPERRTFLRDIDGDGVRDLVHGQVVGSLGAEFSRGLRGGGFAPPVHQIVLPQTLRDFDGDGDLDAATWQGIVPCVAIDGPDAGAIRQYGDGYPGTGGVVPTLGARGPMRGNVLTETRLVGAVGGTFGVFVIGAQPVDLANTPLPGMRLLVAPIGIVTGMAIGGAVGQAGAGWFTLPFLVPPAAAGITVYEQFFVFDAGASHGASASNGLELRFGTAR